MLYSKSLWKNYYRSLLNSMAAPGKSWQSAEADLSKEQRNKLKRVAEDQRDAIIDFLTKQTFTITELKASLEVEEIVTTAPFNTKVDTVVNTNVNTNIPPGIGVQVGISGTGATVAPGVGIGTGLGKGAGFVTEPLQMNKNGGRHGGAMIAIGHAYVGRPARIVPKADTVEEENDFTKVKLLDDNIIGR